MTDDHGKSSKDRAPGSPGTSCGCGHDHGHDSDHHGHDSDRRGHDHDHRGHDHDHHGHDQSPPSAAEREAAVAVSDLLARAGYQPGDPDSFRRGAAALMAAQMVALAAGLTDRTPGGAPPAKERPGRNDPCPCGSGKKYKKCCLERDEAMGAEESGEGRAPGRTPGRAPGQAFGGVVPAMIPRIALSRMQADTARLAELFRRDVDLRLCRFPAARVVRHLAAAAGEAPKEEAERDAWLASQAHAFVQAELGLDVGESGEPRGAPEDGGAVSGVRSAGEVLASVKDALLRAAPRARDDVDALRAIALGLLYHSSYSPASESPHPLEALIFRLTLHEVATEQEGREQVEGALGEDADVVARRLASGDPEAARAFARSFSTLPEGRQQELMQAAARYHDQVVDAVVAGRFPVPLPLCSVLPLVVETVQLVRRTGAEEAKGAAQELAVKRAREGLSAPDRDLFAELCDQWLAGPEATDEDEADMVRYARSLAGSGGAALEAVLLLAFLDHHRVSPLKGEPSPDPEAGLEIDSPEFLEAYGAFLAARGNLKLALRTFRLCAYLGEIPDNVRVKIAAVEEALASQN